MTPSSRSAAAFDPDDAFLCAAKGLPYTFDEWAEEVQRLRRALEEAHRCRDQALTAGVCLPERLR